MRSAASLVCLSIALVLASCSSSDPAPGATDGGSSGNANADTGAADAGVDSGDDTDAGSSRGDGGAVSPADFEIVLAKLNCLFQARCGFLAASEEAACEAAVDAARGAPLPYDSEAALAAGRLTFDAGTAVRCLDLTRTKGCFDQVAPSVTCGAVYSPAVDVGGGCQANAECVNGWCDRGTTRHDGCAGTCKAFTPTQGTCGTGRRARAAGERVRLHVGPLLRDGALLRRHHLQGGRRRRGAAVRVRLLREQLRAGALLR
jgi:hypothetical protein